MFAATHTFLHLKIFLATVTDCHIRKVFRVFHFSGFVFAYRFCFLFFSIKLPFAAVSPCSLNVFFSFIIIFHSRSGQTFNLNRTKVRKTEQASKKYFAFDLQNRNARVCACSHTLTFYYGGIPSCFLSHQIYMAVVQCYRFSWFSH